jgi:hypothetical protein
VQNEGSVIGLFPSLDQVTLNRAIGEPALALAEAHQSAVHKRADLVAHPAAGHDRVERGRLFVEQALEHPAGLRCLGGSAACASGSHRAAPAGRPARTRGWRLVAVTAGGQQGTRHAQARTADEHPTAGAGPRHA